MKKSVFIILISAMSLCAVLMISVLTIAYFRMKDENESRIKATAEAEETTAEAEETAASEESLSDTEAEAATAETIETWGILQAATDDWASSEPRIFMGDSRMVYLSRFVSVGANDLFISKGAMSFDWFRDTAVPELERTLYVNPSYKVIINMGVNDCANNTAGWKDYFAEDYAVLINELIEKYPETKFYYASVGPVSGDYRSNYRSLKKDAVNSMVDYFNQSIQGLCFANYIDLGEYLKNDGFTTMDGIHYDQATCQKIYDYIVAHSN